MTDIADAPAWLQELVNRPKVDTGEPIPEGDRGEPVSEARLLEVLAWLDPGCGYDEWFRTVGAIRATPGNEDDRLLEIAQAWSRGDYWPQGCPSNWAGDEDVEYKFAKMPPKISGVTFGTLIHAARAAGFEAPKSDEQVFGGVEPPPLDDHGFRSMCWLRTQTFPPIEWDWQGLMPSGKPMVITGAAKVGKTTFLLNMACHIAAGASFLGVPTRQAPVVLLLAEDEYGQVRDNLSAIIQARGFDPAAIDARLHIRSVLFEPVASGHRLCQVDDLGNAYGSAFMGEVVVPFLAGLERPVFMVDPLIEFVAFNRFSEQAPRGLVHWLNNVARIGHGVTPLITDHPTIASVEQGRDIGGNVQNEASWPTVGTIKAEDWSEGLVAQQPMSFALKFARYARTRTIPFFRHAGSAAFSMTAAQGHSAEDRYKAVYRYVIEGLEMVPPRLVQNGNQPGTHSTRAIAAALMMEEKMVKAALQALGDMRWLIYFARGSHAPASYDRGAEGPKLSSL